MAQTDASTTPLDVEIAAARAEIAALRHRKSLLSTALLSHHRVTSSLKDQRAKPSRTIPADALRRVTEQANQQSRRNVEHTYRIAAGITAFRVQDPDPHAVDGGRVLGIRIEVFDTRRRTFGTPYYVFLNRPDGAEGSMRVHKHTVPMHVGIRNVAGRYLPAEGKQDLGRFARGVRRELVGCQKRVDAVEWLKVDAGLSKGDEVDEAQQQTRPKVGLESIEAADLSAREVEITWTDGCSGRVKIGKDGSIEGVVVREALRDEQVDMGRRRRDLERAISGGDGRIEGIVHRLLEKERER